MHNTVAHNFSKQIWYFILASLVACVGVLCTPSASAQSTTVLELNIPAQPMEATLRHLAEKHKVQFVFSPAVVRGVMAPELKGSYTIEQAMQKLTEGTRLGYSFNGRDTVVVKEKSEERRVAPITSLAPDVHKAESILVTAQKRDERLIDVPQSVTVLSADDLAKLGATQFRDFANTIPGLTFTTSGAGQTQMNLRGVTTGRDIGVTIGTYVDEVPFGATTDFSAGGQYTVDVGLLFDLDRIEVLRGPQGTLYGASTLGGLIKYVTKRPDSTRFSIDVQTGLSGTRHGGISYNGAVALNAPIVTDMAALRASAFYSRDGGYIDNVALGQKDVNRSGIYGGRLDLLFTPTSALSIRITGVLQNISRDGEGSADYTFEGSPVDGSLDQRRLMAEPFYQRFRLVSGTVTYDLGPAMLTSISSYQTVRSEVAFEVSGIYVPLLGRCPPFCRSYSAVGLTNSPATDKFVQEVRLASEGAKTLEWVVGGFYTEEKSEARAALLLRDLAGQPAPNDVFVSLVPSTYEEYAAFGDLTWRLTSKLDVTGGARYARNRQTFEQIRSGLIGGVSRPSTGSSDDVLTYLANARYHFSDHAIGYLRYATGYRPGGPNFVGRDPITGVRPGPEAFEADRLKSYEVGFKAETADRRLSLDLAGYYIDWSNIQIAAFGRGFGFIDNAAGGASVRGAELALTARPTPGSTVSGAFAYQHAEMSETDPRLMASEGERLPNVPRFTAALNADYQLPLGSLRPRVGATVRHVGARMASFDRSTGFPQYRLPAYTTLDLRAGFTLGRVDTQLYVRNLFDERGQLSAATWRGRAISSVLQPRTIGVSLTTHF